MAVKQCLLIDLPFYIQGKTSWNIGISNKKKSLDEFYFRWLKNRVIEIGKAVSISSIFSHLK